MKRQRFVVGLVLLLLSAFVLNDAQRVNAAPSATFTVNQTADLPDANAMDGRCDTNLALAGDQCSLRAAIQQSNSSPPTDTIKFVSSAAHKITRSGDDDNANKGDLDITASVNLEGRAPSTTIDGNGIDRVFSIHSGLVTMKNLIVRGGHTGGFGGGYFVKESGKLTLTNVVVRENFAADNSGGIENFGTITLDQVTITGNTTNDYIGGLASGRSSVDTSSLTILNSTVANNGGAEAVVDDNASIINSTIKDLTAVGLVSLRNVTIGSLGNCDLSIGCGNAGATSLFNSIIGGCSGTYTSLGYNLIQNQGSCILTGNQAGNLFNVDPRLGLLQNNGGRTLTRGLLAGSPAIDAGNPSGCVFGNNMPLLTDQRGFPRPTDGNGDGAARCDMGAFEVGAVGIGSVSPNRGRSHAGEQVMFDLAWDSPTRWRDLNNLELKFKRGQDVLLWLRFTEGLPTSTISLLDEHGNVIDGGVVGDAKILKGKFGSLDLAQSSFTASGPNDPHVVIHVTVQFKKKAVGKSKILMLATDDFGNAQGPEPAGKWRVKE